MKKIKKYSYSVNGHNELEIFITDINDNETCIATITDAPKEDFEQDNLAQEILEELEYEII